MFVTSAAKVFSPSGPDFICAILDCLPRETQLAVVQPVVPREFDGRLDPKLCLSMFALDMDVHPLFLTREKQKPKPLLAENCWTHGPRFLCNVSRDCRCRQVETVPISVPRIALRSLRPEPLHHAKHSRFGLQVLTDNPAEGTMVSTVRVVSRLVQFDDRESVKESCNT